MVLWVMAILIGLALTLSYISRSESKVSLRSKEYVVAEFLADGGINRAIVELWYRRQAIKPEDETRWNIDGSFRSAEVANGTALVRVIPESAKVDLNKPNPLILKGLVNALGVDTDVQDIIVDSIQDWIDPNDLGARLNGAKSDYYMSLKHPYKCKNAPFDTIDELLMVRGVTPEIFYGTKDKKGIRDFVTVYNKTGKINVKATPKEILMALPNVTEDIANTIIERRKLTTFSMADLQAILPDIYIAIQNYINVPNDNDDVIFTIDSIAKIPGNESYVGIKAIVELEISTNDCQFIYYKMPEIFTLQEKNDKSNVETK
ncbi:MAG: general secretion pathway protein GspK [Nitrospirae bacterium]|nr:general secretion pathway protein GspK [Nitrospirota bacterium]